MSASTNRCVTADRSALAARTILPRFTDEQGSSANSPEASRIESPENAIKTNHLLLVRRFSIKLKKRVKKNYKKNCSKRKQKICNSFNCILQYLKGIILYTGFKSEQQQHYPHRTFLVCLLSTRDLSVWAPVLSV